MCAVRDTVEWFVECCDAGCDEGTTSAFCCSVPLFGGGEFRSSGGSNAPSVIVSIASLIDDDTGPVIDDSEVSRLSLAELAEDVECVLSDGVTDGGAAAIGESDRSIVSPPAGVLGGVGTAISTARCCCCCCWLSPIFPTTERFNDSSLLMLAPVSPAAFLIDFSSRLLSPWTTSSGRCFFLFKGDDVVFSSTSRRPLMRGPDGLSLVSVTSSPLFCLTATA